MSKAIHLQIKSLLAEAPARLKLATDESPAPFATPFSVFIPEQLEAAMNLVEQFYQIANGLGGRAGITAVLSKAEQLVQTTANREMVRYAFMVFLTHHPIGQFFAGSIGPLEERKPHLVKSSQTDYLEKDGPVSGGVLPEPDGLGWYREDPLANYHHEKWHIVYPYVGTPNIAGDKEVKDRQGELFFYMQQQMLARYDAERLALGKERVIPFQYFDNTIQEGYDPQLEGYSMRPANAKWIDLDIMDYSVTDHKVRLKRLQNVVATGSFENGREVDVDRLGATIESSIATEAESRLPKSFYGNYHGFGHVLTALVPPGTVSRPGVMFEEATAIRDPFFYRWHKHIDNFYFSFQNSLAPYDFKDKPYVKGRKQLIELVDTSNYLSKDLYLCFDKKVNPTKDPDFDYAQFGRDQFGGKFWDEDRDLLDFTTKELQTRFVLRSTQHDTDSVLIKHLVHQPFLYVIKLENTVPLVQSITLRIFLCPISEQQDRRAWIEMDKFVYELQPSEKAVIVRKGEQSSVVRKPAVMIPKVSGTGPLEIPTVFDEHGMLRSDLVAEEDNYCGCGWPYHLLVPKGTSSGMPFRLLVVATDWQIDRVGPENNCGSMSFCGAKDKYPDSRSMGYPFDREFKFKIKDTIAVHNSFIAKDITIKHSPDEEGPV